LNKASANATALLTKTWETKVKKAKDFFENVEMVNPPLFKKSDNDPIVMAK